MHARWFPALFLVAALLAPSTAGARVVRLTCRDGIVPPLPRCPAGCTRPLRCDADGQCNGVCTFAIRVCGEVACADRIVPVPVGQRQKIALTRALGAKPTRFVLRCLPHPRGLACPTPTPTTTSATTTSTTTATTLRCHFDTASSTCQGGCPQGGTQCTLVAPDQCDCGLPTCRTCWLTVSDLCTDIPCSSETDCRTEPNLLCLPGKCAVPCPTTTTTVSSAACVPTGQGVQCDPTSSSCCPVPNASVFCGGNPTTCRLGICNPGYANCNMEAADGCEVDLNMDSSNCGGCGRVCPAGTSCAAGSCQ